MVDSFDTRPQEIPIGGTDASPLKKSSAAGKRWTIIVDNHVIVE